MTLPFDMRFSLQDGNGNVSFMRIHTADTWTLAQMALAMPLWATVIDAMTDAKVVGAELLVPANLAAATIKDDPEPQSDNEKGAMFVFKDALGLIYRARLPAIIDACLVPNSKLVDLTNAGIEILVDGFITGLKINDDYVGGRTKANGALTSLYSARQSFRRNLKGKRK
jgi:hypothetical protein